MPEAATELMVELTLPALPENVAVVRQAVAGVADALDVDVALAADMKIAVTEACANAVLHAYDGAAGSLEVVIQSDAERMTVSVRDRGPGFKPLPASHEEAPLGFGLALIASLADAFAVQGSPAGTEVQMTFDLHPDESRPAVPPPTVGQLAQDRPAPRADAVMLRTSAGPLAQPVLGRVVSLMAARADFSIDRLSDAQIVSDALAQHVGRHALDGVVAITIDESDRHLVLRAGPLSAGGGDAILAATELPGIGRLLPTLASDVAVEPTPDSDSGEMLRVGLSEDPPEG